MTASDCQIMCEDLPSLGLIGLVEAEGDQFAGACVECARIIHLPNPAPPVAYRGHRTPTGVCTVWTVDRDGTEAPLPIARGEKPHPHSPEGFQWGFGGSGPATLAESILTAHLGWSPHPRWYQAFKESHVATIDADEWTIDGADVDRFLTGIAHTETEAGR